MKCAAAACGMLAIGTALWVAVGCDGEAAPAEPVEEVAPDATAPKVRVRKPDSFDATLTRTLAEAEAAAAAAQKAWAEYLGPPVVEVNSIGMELALVPPGKFLMGATLIVGDLAHFVPIGERPQHEVTLTRPFYVGRTEVTVAQFRRFVEDAKYRTDAEKDAEGGEGDDAVADRSDQEGRRYKWTNPGFPQEDNHPVVNVSWNDAQAFCAWLSRKEGKTYRLLTEAEWEYAARAGTTTRYYAGDELPTMVRYANVMDGTFAERFPDEVDIVGPNSMIAPIREKDGYVFTAPVGRFRENGFGLHDMYGNVCEWCGDYDSDYANSPVQDPEGPSHGRTRVYRGGGWGSGRVDARTTYRYAAPPATRDSGSGFRIAMVPSVE